MKVGDLVLHRSWREGDTPINETLLAPSWNDFGIVLWVGEDIFRGQIEPAVDYLNQHQETVRSSQKDLEVINESR